jgi:hypothetical protein
LATPESTVYATRNGAALVMLETIFKGSLIFDVDGATGFPK